MMHNEVLEDLTVVKRSGQRVSFNASKVAIAIKKAFESINLPDDKRIFKIFEKVLKEINENYKERKTINVEDIQDLIEKHLQEEKCYEVYESFKDYREKRSLSRKLFAEKSQHKFAKTIERIESSTSIKDGSKNAEEIIYDFGKIITSEYTKSYILDNKSIKALEEGNIYIHDLNYLALGIMPALSLKIDKKEISDNGIDYFVSKILNVQKEIYSEINIDNIDMLLEDYLLKIFKNHFIDNLNFAFDISFVKEYINIKKIEEQLEKEKSIDIDIKCYESYLLNDNVKNIFLKSLEKTKKYLNVFTQKMLKKIFNNLENGTVRNVLYSIKFLSANKLINQIINEEIFNIIKENVYQKICFIIDVNGITNINDVLDTLNKNNKIYLVNNSMYFASGKKFNETSKMVVCSTAINLARLALKYENKPINDFYKELESILELTKNELLLAFETIGNKNKEYYKSIFNGNVYDDEKLEDGQKIRKVIKNGIINIEIVGLNECTNILSKNETDKLKILNEILDYLNKKCEKYILDTKLNFKICETRCEKARRNLLSFDKAIYGKNEYINKDKYDLIDYNQVSNYKKLSEIQHKFSGGKIIDFNISKLSLKELSDILDIIKKSNIEFAKITRGKNEN